jgi:hypothetical protein
MSHSGIFGQSMSGALGQNMSGALGSQNPYMNQSMAAQQRAAYMAQQQAYTAALKPEWMINGKSMSITEFADELFGDTPQRTMFLLKYSDKGK